MLIPEVRTLEICFLLKINKNPLKSSNSVTGRAGAV
jgi:hypothetical protein